MKNKLAFATTLLIIISLQISVAQTTFQKLYGTNVGTITKSLSIMQTSDGGYISSGHIEGVGTLGCYLIKTNPMGDTLWTKVIGGSYDYGFCTVQTSDGGYIMAGEKYVGTNVLNDIFIAKLTSTGDTAWTKCLGGILNSYGRSVLNTNDGGYMVTGTVRNGTSNDVFLLKLNAIGDTLWTKTYGGTGFDGGIDLKPTSDGGYIVVGGTTSSGAGTNDVLLLKTNSTGSLMWAKTYGGSNYDVGNSVVETSDGYLFSGSTSSFGAGLTDQYLIKTDFTGNLVWSQTLGSTHDEFAESIQKTTDGNYIVTGTTDSTGSTANWVSLIKINNAGDTLWTKRYNKGVGLSVNQTTNGGYIIGGTSNNYTSNGNAYLIKTDASGNTGCGSTSTNLIKTTAPTLVSTPTLTVSSGIPIHHHAITVINSSKDISTLCFTSSIDEIQNDETVSIYPNPCSSQITITFNQPQKHTNIKVMNLLGECLQQLTTSNQQLTLDMSVYAKGVYFIRIEDENKKVINKKVVAQ